MGVSELWSLLKSVGVTKFWSGGEGTHAIIVTEVEGKSIAIDLSAWIVQATCQPNLVEVFSDPGSQALIVTFNRVVNYIRYGCVPVGLTEGRPPAEKLERLQQRFKSRNGYVGGGTGNSHFLKMGKAVAALLQSLGLPMVQSPGEEEAMCAALNEAGLVDACATFDGDVLLFGAHTVYHTLKLQSNEPHNSEVLKVELEGIRSMLGIESGGADAMVALSLLCGGDYAIKGAEHVGSRQAVKLLQHLLQGRQDDEHVLDDLSELVSYPPDPEMEFLSAQGCTGCKQCKHPGNRKSSIQKHSKRNPCSCCPASFVQEYQTCEARPEVPCQCDFHTKELQRAIDKAVRRIQATPGFSQKAAEAAAAYHNQRQLAATAVDLVRRKYAVPVGQMLGWMHRPDVQKVAEQLDWLTEEQVRSKLLPLLMQWDLCHPHEAEREFVAEGISKVHVQKAEKEEDCWRYMLRWRRLAHVNTQLVEADNEWLKKSDSEKRSVKMSLIEQHQPELIKKFEQEQSDKLMKKSKPAQKKAAAKTSKPASGLITNFYSQHKKPPTTKGVPDLADQAKPRGLSRGLIGMARPDQAAQKTLRVDQAARSSQGAQAEPDLAAQNRPEPDTSTTGDRVPEKAASSSHDAELERLEAYTASQELVLRSPYAWRLRQQEQQPTDSQAPRQSALMYDSPVDLQEAEQPGLSWNAVQSGTSLRAGQLDTAPASRQSAGIPDAEAPRLDVHRSPKRNARVYNKNLIVISPDSQTHEGLEIDLLSPSPAKRRKTPPSSPQPKIAADLDKAPAALHEGGHDLRPAGPSTEGSQRMPSPTMLFRGDLQTSTSNPEVITHVSMRAEVGRAASQSLAPEQAADRRPNSEEANCRTPDCEQAAGSNLEPITSVSRIPEVASRGCGSPRGHQGHDAAAPDTPSTAVWGDLEISVSPADSPVASAPPGLRCVGCSSVTDNNQCDLLPELEQASVPTQARVGGSRLEQHSLETVNSATAVANSESTPAGRASSLRWQSRMGASPIDLATPSTGVASTVATPTFSESSELVDLTQT